MPSISPVRLSFGRGYQHRRIGFANSPTEEQAVAKNMKNPTAKAYEGPKNYRKLIQNIPKLYSLSNKQLQAKNPFEKEFITSFILGSGNIRESEANSSNASAPNLASPSASGAGYPIGSMTDTRAVSSYSAITDNMVQSKGIQENDFVFRSYLIKPKILAGKLESRQINEVAGRSLNIWRNSKKRLSKMSIRKNPLTQKTPMGVQKNMMDNSATPSSGLHPRSNFGDY